jgi:hypothetical protein
MSNLEPLLADLEHSFDNLQESMAGLTHEQLLMKWFGDWCVYDICSHIIGWHHEMDDALERISRGEKPVPEGVDYGDADAWNARFIETWRQSSGEAVLEELRSSKDLFVKAARQVPDDKFEEGRAAFRILHATAIDHYAEHAQAIFDWRKAQGF